MVIEQKEEGLSVLLEGELGHHEALSALRSLEDAISQQSPSRMELDFSGVSFMDSSGIGLIMGRYKLMQMLGGVLRVIHVPQYIARVIRLSGLDKLGVLEKDVKKA